MIPPGLRLTAEVCHLCATGDPPRRMHKIAEGKGMPVCPKCDRIACPNCTQPVFHSRAPRCPHCGQVLPLLEKKRKR